MADATLRHNGSSAAVRQTITFCDVGRRATPNLGHSGPMWQTPLHSHSAIPIVQAITHSGRWAHIADYGRPRDNHP
jgi:hypothetical protein